MKKSLSVALVVAMVSSMFASMAFAEDAAATTAAPSTPQEKFDALSKLGVLEGDENGANLDGFTTRAQIAKILTKAFALTEDASAASVYKDLDGSGWATGFIGAVTKAGLMEGPADGKFDPTSNVTLEQLATVLVRAFKLDTSSTDVGNATVDGWAKGYVAAAIKAGLISASTDFTGTAKRSDLVNSAYTSVQKAAEEKAKQEAEEAAKKAAALDISSAVAINSKTIEVKLNTASKAADLIASNATVKDAAGTAIEVTSVAAAQYVTDGKTVIVTLKADTTSGTLYSIASGTTSVNFGGVAADTGKPAVASSGVTAPDFNKIDIKFNEAINLDSSAVITVKEAYGTNSLKVNSVKQTAKDTIELVTDAQVKNTLYALDIAGVKDFAGNTMDQDKGQTVVSNVNDGDLKLSAAQSNNPDEVLVKFNNNVDSSTIDVADFTITDAYGSSTVTVKAARVATTSDKDETGVVKGNIDGHTAQYVVLDVSGLKDNTLYNVTAKGGLKSTFGKALSSTSSDVTTSFVGIAVPTTALEFQTTAAEPASNTAVTVHFARKVDKATVETVANYAIVESYNTANKLAVSKAELQSNGYDVKLTVSPMGTNLYSLTVTNVKDNWGNGIKTDSSANTTTFVGQAVQDKITTASVARVSGSDTLIDVTFNKNIGSSAQNVGLYSIDGSVGYPQAAAKQSDNKTVRLTIPKTNVGQVYTLTIKGLANADGVAMDSAGITATFVGQGNAAGLPKINSAWTTDKQTLRISFNRDVTDASIKGFIWDGTQVNAGQLGYVTAGSTATPTDLGGKKAFQDPDNKNILVIRSAAADFATTSTNNSFDLKAIATTQRIHSDTLTKRFVGNSTDAVGPKLTAAVASNKYSLTVYFDSPVADTLTASSFVIGTNEDGTVTSPATAPTINNAVRVDSKTYQLATTAQTDRAVYYVVLKEGSSETHNNKIVGGSATDLSSVLGIQATNSNTTADYASAKFAGNGADVTNFSGLSAMSPNKHQIDVYFPEKMNAASVTNATYYRIYTDSTGATATGAAYQPVYVSYDSSSNKASLFLQDNSVYTAGTKYYVGVSSQITNATGSNHVKAASTSLAVLGSGQVSTFAAVGIDPVLPKIASVTSNVYNNTLTVKFENPVAFGDSATAAVNSTDSAAVALNQIGAQGATGQTFAGNVTSFFTLTGVVDTDGNAITSFTATRKDNKTVEITFASGVAIKNGTGGKVEVSNALTSNNTIFSISKDVAKTGTDAQKVNFGVGTAVAN